jgi:RecB family exonuclease
MPERERRWQRQLRWVRHTTWHPWFTEYVLSRLQLAARAPGPLLWQLRYSA